DADERRGEQHVAEAAQRDHQDARALRQVEARHRNSHGAERSAQGFARSLTLERAMGLLFEKARLQRMVITRRGYRDGHQHIARQGSLGALMSFPRPWPGGPPRAASYRR